MSTSPTVPAARFDFREFPPARRLAAFGELTRSVYELRAAGDPLDFEAEARGLRVGEIVFNRVRFSAACFHRDHRHLRGAGHDFLVLEAQHSGAQTLLMDHGLVRMLPGHIYLRDWALRFESTAESMELDSIIIPRHRLEASAAMHARNPVLSWSMSEPAGRTLLILWKRLLLDLATVPEATAQTLTEAFLGFLDGLLGYGKDPYPPATLEAVEQFLAVRLRADVSVDEICRHFRMSRSTLYRLFQRHGGLLRFLAKARLERCYADLLRADPSRVRVGDIAASWGFIDPAGFSRAFRRRFAMQPSRVPGAGFAASRPPLAVAEQPSSHSFSDYMHWLDDAAGRGTPECPAPAKVSDTPRRPASRLP